MVQFTKDSGQTINKMGEVSYNMPPVIFMKVNSSIIWLQALEYIRISTATNMLAIGTKIRCMALAKKPGMTAANIRDSIKTI